jgi:hypothetical protein
MKAKEIILLILIIGVGIIFYHAQTGRIWIEGEWDGGIFFGLDEFVYEETEEISPPLAPRLIIDNDNGQVEVQGSPQDFISITFEKRIYRRNQEQADEVAGKLDMIVQQDSEGIRISTNREDFRNRRFRTNFRLKVPEHLVVEVKNSYGEVRIFQVQQAAVRNPHGEVFVTDIAGELDIKNNYRDVEVEHVRADCFVDSHNCRVTVGKVEGNVEISHKYGKVYLEDIGRTVTVKGSNMEVFGHNISGLTDIQTSYRKVELEEVGPVKIDARNSRIEISGAEENVDIEATYGKVELFDIRGNLRVDGNNLEVYGDSIIGENIYVSTSYRKVELTRFQGKTEIIQSNGNVGLEPLPLTHSIEVDGRYTDITFYWPSGDRYPIEARVKGGHIDWETSEALTREEENGFSVIKAFGQEKDQPSISLLTVYGSIRIEEFIP